MNSILNVEKSIRIVYSNTFNMVFCTYSIDTRIAAQALIKMIDLKKSANSSIIIA
jgi:hypothetical protein